MIMLKMAKGLLSAYYVYKEKNEIKGEKYQVRNVRGNHSTGARAEVCDS